MLLSFHQKPSNNLDTKNNRHLEVKIPRFTDTYSNLPKTTKLTFSKALTTCAAPLWVIAGNLLEWRFVISIFYGSMAWLGGPRSFTCFLSSCVCPSSLLCGYALSTDFGGRSARAFLPHMSGSCTQFVSWQYYSASLTHPKQSQMWRLKPKKTLFNFYSTFCCHFLCKW